VVFISLHEAFHLVNYHLFPEFVAPMNDDLPEGLVAEVELFGGRVVSEWTEGHEGDFSHLRGLYVRTSAGDIRISEYSSIPFIFSVLDSLTHTAQEDLLKFMSEIYAAKGIFDWKLDRRGRRVHPPQPGTVRTYAVDIKPREYLPMKRDIERLPPGFVRMSMLDGCHH
jgi:hypothetical protein